MTETVDIPAWVELIVREIAIAYPGIDAGRLRQVRLKLARFDPAAARQGWDEYITAGGDGFFNLDRFLAIVIRVFHERRQKEDLAERHRRASESVAEAKRHVERILNAERMISEMNEEEIAAEWAKVQGQLEDSGRSVFSKYDAAKIRKSAILKAHVAEMMR